MGLRTDLAIESALKKLRLFGIVSVNLIHPQNEKST